MNLVCDECHLSKRCKYFGTSPLEIEGAEIKCVMLAETYRTTIVQIPTELVVNEKGTVIEARVTIVPIKKSLWARMLKK